MRFRFMFSTLFLSSFLFACAPTVTPAPEPEILNVYATPAAQPWLEDVYACAPPGVIISLSDDGDADIALRIGEPEFIAVPAYQIGEEEVLIVTSRESVVQNLTLDEVRKLFAGTDSLSVQVWVYASGEDVQGLFEQVVMSGRNVTSSARLAVSPQQMSDVLNAETDAVGILPRHWKAGNPREVYSVGKFPVLVLLKDEPQGAVQEIIACLQK